MDQVPAQVCGNEADIAKKHRKLVEESSIKTLNKGQVVKRLSTLAARNKAPFTDTHGPLSHSGGKPFRASNLIDPNREAAVEETEEKENIMVERKPKTRAEQANRVNGKEQLLYAINKIEGKTGLGKDTQIRPHTCIPKSRKHFCEMCQAKMLLAVEKVLSPRKENANEVRVNNQKTRMLMKLKAKRDADKSAKTGGGGNSTEADTFYESSSDTEEVEDEEEEDELEEEEEEEHICLACLARRKWADFYNNESSEETDEDGDGGDDEFNDEEKFSTPSAVWDVDKLVDYINRGSGGTTSSKTPPPKSGGKAAGSGKEAKKKRQSRRVQSHRPPTAHSVSPTQRRASSCSHSSSSSAESSRKCSERTHPLASPSSPSSSASTDAFIPWERRKGIRRAMTPLRGESIGEKRSAGHLKMGDDKHWKLNLLVGKETAAVNGAPRSLYSVSTTTRRSPSMKMRDALGPAFPNLILRKPKQKLSVSAQLPSLASKPVLADEQQVETTLRVLPQVRCNADGTITPVTKQPAAAKESRWNPTGEPLCPPTIGMDWLLTPLPALAPEDTGPFCKSFLGNSSIVIRLPRVPPPLQGVQCEINPYGAIGEETRSIRAKRKAEAVNTHQVLPTTNAY